jgi:hypothetical protein
MFTAVDRFFAAANLTFTLGNLEFAFEDILGPSASVIHPAGDSKVGFLHNFLDDRGGGGELGDSGGIAHGTSRRLDDTAGGTDEDFGLTAGNLSFTLSNITFALGEGLGPFGSHVSPNALVYSWLRAGNDMRYWSGGSSSVLGG